MNDLKFTTAGDYMKKNERIKQFAQEAGFKVDWQHEDIQAIKMARFEKFAELIVVECADIAAKNQAENMNWDIAEIIKEHFGVEE
jgi:hypothetical protein